MKRILSWVLTVVMIIGMFGSFSVQFALADSATAEYDALVTSGSSEYGKTMVVNSAWTETDLVAGNKLSFVFRGETYEETYDANRHFNTFGAAQDAWFARYTSGGNLTSEVAKVTPNYILLGEILRTDPDGNPMGTAEQKNTCLSDMWIRFSANLYGATAGIDPNDPNYNPNTAIPGSDWALNSAWVNPTVLKTTIFQSTRVGRNQLTTDTRYEKLLTAAGVNNLTLKIDGIQFDATDFNDVPVWQYGVSGYKRTFNLVVRNTFVNGGEFFVACNEDASKNLYNYDLDNLRFDGLVQPLFVARPNTIDANRINYVNGKNANSVIEEGGSYTGNGYAAVGETDRGVDWTFTNSRFANNKSSYMWRFSDRVYLARANFKFDGCLFDNAVASEGATTSGMFAFKNFTDDTGRFPRFSYTFNNNTINFSKGKVTSLIFGYTWATQPYDVTATGNRFIGFAGDAFPAIAKDYPDMATKSNFVYDGNYFADKFVSVNDLLGKQPEYKGNSTDQPNPVDVETTKYYLDYNMTTSPTDLLIKSVSFANKVHRLNINHKTGVISAIIREETSLSDISFAPTGEGVTIKMYSDEACENEVNAIAAADIEKTHYIVSSKNGSVKKYTLNLTTTAVQLFTAWTDATGEIDTAKAAVILPSGSYTENQAVEVIWQDGYWEVQYGTNAFTTVDAAVLAGKTDIILPVGTSPDLTVNSSVRIFGNRYNVPINVKGKDVTDDWTMAPEWESDRSAIGTITVGAGATPTTEAGAGILIKGVEIKTRVADTARTVSNYATDITVDNCYVTSNVRFTFNISSKNASNTDATYTNNDSFTLKNSRYLAEYSSSSRIFSEISPAYLTVADTYFGKDFYTLGWPKYREGVKTGVITYTGNMFRDGRYAVVGITGAGQYFDASDLDHRVVVSDNVFFNAASDREVFNVYPMAFKSIEIVDNYFIDEVGKSHPFYLSDSGASTNFAVGGNADSVIFKRNRVIGMFPTVPPFGTVNVIKNVSDNYFADSRTPDVAIAPYGLLEGSDYYLDYAMTVKASDMDIIVNGDYVGYGQNVISVIAKAGEDYIPEITATDTNIVYKLYGDEMLTAQLPAVNKAGLYYAAAVKNGVTKTYPIYISFGNANAPEYDGAYLLDEESATMPTGTTYVKTFKGTEYKFTAGVNAYASLVQITTAHNVAGGEGKVNVLLPAGTYDSLKVTGNVNIIGDNAVVKTAPDTKSPIKIAAVGDSITEANAFGEPDRYTFGYPARLQLQLDSIYGEGNYEVENFGKGNSTAVPVHNSTDTTLAGATRSQYTQGSWYYSAQDYNPDVVIIMIGHNDTDTALFQSKEVYKANVQAMIDTFRALPSHPQIIISGCHDRADGYRRNILVDTIIPAQQELAAENNIIYIDNFSKTVDINENSDISSDGLHFTKKGYEFLARLIREGMADVFNTERAVTTDGVTVDENAVVAKSDKLKVALIGDDITYGSAALKNYPDFLRELLGDNYEVRNYGEPKATVANWKTVGGYAKVGDYTSSIAWKPDIAVFMLGHNDSGDVTADYTALIKEYEAQGAKIYVANTIKTSANAAKVNGYIKNVAKTNGWAYIDTYSLTKDFGAEMINGKYLTVEGNSALAKVVYESVGTTDFVDAYDDAYNQIDSKNAVVVDLEMTGSPALGSALTYNWDGAPYTFYYGINAFKSVDDAIASDIAQKDGKVQILIPANNIGTTSGRKDISDTAYAGNMTEIEIYGVNRNIDPNDRSATVKDPTADWSLNKEWGKYGESGLDEFWIMTTGENTLKGKLTFNGITMRDTFVDQQRSNNTATANGDDYDTRDLTITFENVVYDETAVGYNNLFHLNNPRVKNNTADSADKLVLRNYRIKNLIRNGGRMFATSSYPNIEIDGLYVNCESTSGKFQYLGFLQCAAGPDEQSVVVKNSNFRNAGATLLPPLGSVTVKTDASKTSTVSFLDNVYVNCTTYSSGGSKGLISLFPEWTDTMVVEGNIFVTDNEVFPVDFATSSGWTVDTYNYAPHYSFKNNSFIMKDAATLKAALEEASVSTATTGIDITGIYVGTKDGAIDPATLELTEGKFKWDYYYDDINKIHKRIGSDFASTYVDAKGEIKADAVVYDASLSANAGNLVSYTWDGKLYSFEVGVNAFATIDAALASNAAKDGTIQIIVPANNIGTMGKSDAKNFFISDTADAAKMTSIEIYGVNRDIDPNDKSASKNDPLADWTRTKEWGVNGESGIGHISIDTTGANSLKGKLSFNGVTLRGIVVDLKRSAQETGDARNLALEFENIIVDWTTANTYAGGLFSLNNKRPSTATFANGDSLKVKNFRVEDYTYGSGVATKWRRVFLTQSPPNIEFDNFYLNGATSNMDYFGYLQNGCVAAGESNITFKNSNFRNGNMNILMPQLSDTARVTDGVEVNIKFLDNVFYECSTANASWPNIALFGEWTTSTEISGNVFYNTNGTVPVGFMPGTNNVWTKTDVDYAQAIGFNLKNNTYVVSNLSSVTAARPNDVTTVDFTGSFVSTAVDGLGVAPGTGFSADYYYLDFAKTVKNGDVAIESVILDGATDVAFDNGAKTITAVVPETTVVFNPAVKCINTSVVGKFVDGEGNIIEKIDMADAKDGKYTAKVLLTVGKNTVAEYAVTLSTTPVVYGDYADRDDTDDIVKKTAVAISPDAAGKSVGDKIVLSWNGENYVFTVGVNAFASFDAVPGDIKQVIIPTGVVGDINIGRSVEIYGNGYDTVPYVIDGDDAAENPEWSMDGNSIVSNINVLASATPKSADGTTILVSGVRITKGIVDSARTVSQYKTDIKLKNNVLDRSVYTGEEREFHLWNAQNNNADTSYTNIDSFTIEDMYFINRGKHTKHALFQEQVPAYLTIDGFVCNNSMPSIGFPKWASSVKKGEMKLVNCFFKDHDEDASRFDMLVYFTGHKATSYTAEQRKGLDLSLVIDNNKFVNCGTESLGYDYKATAAPIEIHPASFKTITVTNNEFISEFDYNYAPVVYSGYAGASDNNGDMSAKFNMKNNRFIGTLAPWKVNADTFLDMSDNYFETYTIDYANGVSGDIPADVDADYYLDYAMTTKVSDTVPAASNLEVFKANTTSRVIYGYAADDIAPTFTKDGFTYTVSGGTLDIEVGKATKATVTAKKGDITFTYQLYVIGVKDLADVDNAATAIDGITDPTLYYPTLHGAPNGIEVVTYYAGKPVKFTTGKNVATNEAMFGFFGDNVVIPDDITDISLTLLTEVNIYAKGTLKALNTRKVKIGAVGDSITAGGWPEHMQSYLGTTNYEVKNFGQSGATVTETIHLAGAERKYTIYAKSKYDASIAYNPDFIIIGLGTNDSYGNRWTSNDRFVEQYVELIRTYQALESKPAVYLTPMTEAYDNHGRTLRRDNNILYLQYLVAEMTGAKILDARTLLDHIFEPTAHDLCTDLLHPTAAGYKIMGETIGAELQKTYTAIGDISVNGATVDTQFASSFAGTTLTIADAVVNVDTALVDNTNIKSLTLTDNIYLKEGNTVATLASSDVLASGGALTAGGNAVDNIDLTKTETVTYTAEGGSTIGVSTTSPQSMLAALQVTVANVTDDGSYCVTLWNAFDSARNANVFAISDEDALKAIADIKALGGHSFTTKPSGNEATPADCDNAKTEYVMCDRCDAVSDSVTVSVGEKLGHSFTTKDSGNMASKADCDNAQRNYVQCDRCDAVSDEVTVAVGEALGHSHTTKPSGVEATPADCDNAKTEYVMCDRCDNVHDTLTVSVGEKLGHSFTTKPSGNEATPADCDNAKTEYVMCDRCDAVSDSVTVSVGEKLGHSFTTKDSGNMASKADCYNAQKNYVQCDRCDAVSDKVTVAVGEALGHDMKPVAEDPAKCGKPGTTAHKDCSRCDYTEGKETIPALEHKFTNYVDDKNATCCNDGTKTAKCDNGCGKTDTKVIAGTALGHGDTSKIFKDVQAGKWYNNAINYAYTHKFISGMSETEFGVSTEVTRGMFITILARIAGVDTSNNNVKTKFTDVESGKYFTAAIKWASENKIVNGMTATTFAPNAPIQRQQLCVMIVNFAKHQKIELTASEKAISFKDAAAIGNYAKTAVATCQMADIVNGYANGNGFDFKPTNTATRAEAAQILYKFHKDFVA